MDSLAISIHFCVRQIQRTGQIDSALRDVIRNGIIPSSLCLPIEWRKERQWIEERPNREPQLWNLRERTISCHAVALSKDQCRRPRTIRHMRGFRIQKKVRNIGQALTKSPQNPALFGHELLDALELGIAQCGLQVARHVFEGDFRVEICAGSPAMVAQKFAAMV